MSSSDSIDSPLVRPQDPDPLTTPDIDPAIAEAVDTVGNRFGAQGLEQMISYAEKALSVARQALDQLAASVDQSTGPGEQPAAPPPASGP